MQPQHTAELPAPPDNQQGGENTDDSRTVCCTQGCVSPAHAAQLYTSVKRQGNHDAAAAGGISKISTLYKMSPTPLSGACDGAVMPPWCRRRPHYCAGKRCQLAVLCCSSNPRFCKRRGCKGTVQQPHPPCRTCLHSHTQGPMLSNGPAFTSNTPALTWCSNKAFDCALNDLPLFCSSELGP